MPSVFGADRVVLSSDLEQMKAVYSRFDVIIDTAPYDHDVNPYMPTLVLEGVLVLVGYMGTAQHACERWRCGTWP